MALEAYSATKPGLPYRGWLSAILLLLVSTGLALALTWRRGGQSLSERISPPGWDMSYHVPRGFEPASQAENGNLYRYVSEQPSGEAMELSFWRLDARDGSSATKVAERVLQDGDLFSFRQLFGPGAERVARKLGGRAAVELQDAGIPMLARAAVLKNGWGYAVALKTMGANVAPETYHLFELACRSVTFDH